MIGNLLITGACVADNLAPQDLSHAGSEVVVFERHPEFRDGS